jgi:Tol biopolymer transport system component/DNA-binding winged helix-turn-helix (wHTH) protein
MNASDPIRMPLPGARYRFDRFVLDPLSLRLTAHGETRTLEPKSFRLLQFLIENRRRVLSKDEILRVVWEGVAVTDNALTRAVAQVRKALDDDPKQPRYIETIPTVGYRFIAEVNASADLPAPAASAQAPSRGRVWVWGTAAVVLAVAGMAAAHFLGTAPPGQAVNQAVPFTTYPGNEIYPSFSPDGNQVAFSWSGEHDDNFDIYVKAIGAETPLRLTRDPAPDMRPQWSPDGRAIAFERVFPGGRIAIMLVPPLGGSERKLVEVVSRAAERGGGDARGTSWSPDGKWLAVAGDMESKGSDGIFLVSVETGEVRPLTQPPSNDQFDFDPAFSADGASLVFSRQGIRTGGDFRRLSLGPGFVPLGEPQILPTRSLRATITPAWASGGREIVFRSIYDSSLYRMPATASSPPVRIAALGTGIGTFGLSRDGRRLAYSVGARNSNIWRLDLAAKGAAPERWIASTRREAFPQYSPDGRRIVFYSNRSGSLQIWVCDADGSRASAITSTKPAVNGTPRWSPDGRTISFDSNITGAYQIYTVSADGGKVRQMTCGAGSNYTASWSRDGRWIYFASNAAGDAQVWKIPSHGGAPVQVTRHGGMAATESPDGKTLYYNKAVGKGSLWKMPVEGGPEEKIAEPIFRYNYAASDKGVYLTRDGSIDFVNFATGAIRTVLKTPRPDVGLAVSPDGRYLLFAQVDAIGSDLMLVENFR